MPKLQLKHRADKALSIPTVAFSSDKDAEIAFTVRNPREDPELYGGLQGRVGTGFDVRAGGGALEKLGLRALPTLKSHQIARALLWLDEDELVSKLVGVQVEFASLGMSLRCQQIEGAAIESLVSSGNSDNDLDGDVGTFSKEVKAALVERAKFQQILNQVKKKWDFSGLVENLLRDWFATDSMILYWKIRPGETTGGKDTDSSIPVIGGRSALLPKIVNICALNPAEVDWNDSFGVDRMKVKIGVDLKKRIHAAMTRKIGPERERAIESLLAEGLELKWIEAVVKGRDWVQLSNDDGEYWIVKTKARRHNGLARPSMKTVFLPLESRKAMREGDFAAAFMMKHFIFQIKCGESIPQGPMAGQRTNWASTADTDKLLAALTNTSQATRVATNHTVEFKFIFPPKEMFDPAKFAKVESQIYTWADVTVAVMSGGGSPGDNQKSGTGFIGIKKLMAKLQKAREGVDWMFQEFFEHSTVQSQLDSPENCEIAVTFDENALKEPRQLLEELKFLVAEGIVDARTAARELGRNPNALHDGKLHTRAENAGTKVWEPINKKPGAQSAVDIDSKKGGVLGDHTTPTEETRTNTGTPQ